MAVYSIPSKKVISPLTGLGNLISQYHQMKNDELDAVAQQRRWEQKLEADQNWRERQLAVQQAEMVQDAQQAEAERKIITNQHNKEFAWDQAKYLEAKQRRQANFDILKSIYGLSQAGETAAAPTAAGGQTMNPVSLLGELGSLRPVESSKPKLSAIQDVAQGRSNINQSKKAQEQYKGDPYYDPTGYDPMSNLGP